MQSHLLRLPACSERLPVQKDMEQLPAHERKILESTLSSAIDCIYDPKFRERGAENRLVFPLPAEHEVDSMPAEQQELHFLRYNFCRYRIQRTLIRSSRQRLRLKLPDAKTIIHWAWQALETRRILAAGTFRLARKAIGRLPHNCDREEMLGLAYEKLFSAIDFFDCSIGLRFSTYLYRAVLAAKISFLRAGLKRQQTIASRYEPKMQLSDVVERRHAEQEAEWLEEAARAMLSNATGLTESERKAIAARYFARGDGQKTRPMRPAPYREAARTVGVSPQRIHQLEASALVKLRDALGVPPPRA